MSSRTVFTYNHANSMNIARWILLCEKRANLNAIMFIYFLMLPLAMKPLRRWCDEDDDGFCTADVRTKIHWTAQNLRNLSVGLERRGVELCENWFASMLYPYYLYTTQLAPECGTSTSYRRLLSHCNNKIKKKIKNHTQTIKTIAHDVRTSFFIL